MGKSANNEIKEISKEGIHPPFYFFYNSLLPKYIHMLRVLYWRRPFPMSKKSTHQPRNDTAIQLQQKMIHYRSEISRYQQLVEKYEKKLEQGKQHVLLLQSEIEDLKNKEPEIKEITRIEIQPYFSYSLMLPQVGEEEKEIVIMGNFIIKNIGNLELTNPIICLKVQPHDSSSLSGKIKLFPTKDPIDDENRLFEEAATEEWIYLQEDWRKKVKETGEHWLRPAQQMELASGEQLSFSNFNLTLNPTEKNSSIVVTGFVYFQELQQGIPCLNKIIVNY